MKIDLPIGHAALHVVIADMLDLAAITDDIVIGDTVLGKNFHCHCIGCPTLETGHDAFVRQIRIRFDVGIGSHTTMIHHLGQRNYKTAVRPFALERMPALKSGMPRRGICHGHVGILAKACGSGVF